MRISDWSSDVCSSDLFFADQILDQQMAAGGVGHPRIEGRELLRDDRDIIIMLDRPLAELFARQAAIGPHDGKGVLSGPFRLTARLEGGIEILFCKHHHLSS